MKQPLFHRFLSALLALVMVFSMLPMSALAADGTTATLVTDLSSLKAGDQVVIVGDGYDVAMSTNQKNNNRGEAAITRSGNQITLTSEVQILTLESGSLQDSWAFNTGAGYLYAAGQSKDQNGSKNYNYLRTQETLDANGSWSITMTDGVLSVKALGDNGCNDLRYNSGSSLFSAYSSGQNPVQLYKVDTGAVTPPVDPTPTESTPDESNPDESTPDESNPDESKPQPTIVSIADALAGEASAEFTVKGVVTLLDSKNIYVQDDTGAICVRVGAAPTDLVVGDTVIGTGLRETYHDMPQLNSGSYEKSEGMTLAAREVASIAELCKTELLCQYVKLTDLEVTAVAGNALTLKDAAGDTVVTYKSVLPGTFIVGDKLTFTGALGIYDGTYQLRNTVAEEIVKTFAAEPPVVEPTKQQAEKMAVLPENGDVVIIYNSGNAMGAAASNSKLTGIPATPAEGKLPVEDTMAQLTVSVTEGVYTFTLDGKYLTSGETGGSLSFADTLTDCGKWTIEAATEGTWYIKNVGANFNGNYNQALEYYSGFTTYGHKETEIYQMELYLAGKAKTSGHVTDLADLAAGDTVVIYNPANLMALSTTYDGFYNNGVAVTVTGETLSGFTASEVWTVGMEADGSYTFSTANGQKLSMGTQYSSMPLDDVNTTWTVTPAATAGCFYIQNVARGSYMEWYADKGNWSSYYSNSNEALFAQAIYRVVGDIPSGGGSSTGPVEGEQVVIYNLSAQGVLALEGDNQVITNAPATISEGTATAANGALIFTIQKNGEYYRFYNETYGYLCSNGTGNNAFYSLEASEDADWKLTSGKKGGYNLESRTAKFNGKYSQYLEYYAGSYKSYSMYNVTDYDIYEFCFYPCANEEITEGIVNKPDVVFLDNPNAYIGADYTYQFSVDAVFGVAELTVTAAGKEVEAKLDDEGIYTLVIPAADVDAAHADTGVLAISISGKDNKGVTFANGSAIDIIDEPTIEDVTPAANAETGDNKRPLISARIGNAGENPTVTMTVNDEAVEAVFAEGVISYTPAEDLADGTVVVTVTVTRADEVSVSRTWRFTVGKAQYKLYFGQLHSHTTYSDGSGSLDSALSYIENLPDSANVDFVAFTDHSNYFDSKTAANPETALYDMSMATASSQTTWEAYKGAVAAFNERQAEVVALAGFEMTWSGGPGHINTFNTPGIVSRNNTTLNNKTSDAGMKAYYALLSQPEGAASISQFNHPGSTFGTFSDFAYWDAVIDSRIHLVEVGNGEGQVGAGGYFPSYEYYTMALDKGWHVAPTNNQDNHKGKWGNANDARDVILTDNFTEEGIYEALRAMRVYATEDKNLSLYYSINGYQLGSSITEVPEKLNVSVTVSDPDATDSISKVELIVNSGKVAHSWTSPSELASGSLTAQLDPDYSYYYVRVTQGDGDLAVTAPVWVGESLKLGISSVVSGTSTPVTGEELTLTTTLFNSEAVAAKVKSLTYAVKGGAVIATDDTGYDMAASGTLEVPFQYTPDKAKVTTITVTAVVEQEGKDYTFTMDVELDIQDSDKLVFIGFDGSHYNEYVNGNYKNSMGNFGTLAAKYNVRYNELMTKEALLSALANPKYKAMVLTAPTRRGISAVTEEHVYGEEEIAAIKAFNERGGIVLFMGYSDFYETSAGDSLVGASMEASQHMAAQQNLVLQALGSSLRLGDDATGDKSHNDGREYGIYVSQYGESDLLKGLVVDPDNLFDTKLTQIFNQYGGSSVYVASSGDTPSATIPASVTPVVYGNVGTTTVVDNDGVGVTGIQYPINDTDSSYLLLATEDLGGGKGMILVTGGCMLANWQLQVKPEDMDSSADLLYANYTITENLLQMINPVEITSIADVQAETEEGVKFTIEGIVTSNASGYDKDTAFFDCIYLQDDTAGINAFPVAGNYKIGDKVRVTGTTSSYQGERQIAVSSIEVIGQGEVEPTSVTAEQINSGSVLGKLITIQGTVESFEEANGLIQTIMVKDAAGKLARVFIDGYITTSKEVENLELGADITVTGLASYDNTFNAPEGPFARIRIRNRADVVVTPFLGIRYEKVSVSLSGDIGLNYYLRLSEEVASDEGAYLVFTMDGATQKVMVSEAKKQSDGTYRFSCKLAAKDMACTVSAQMYTSDGTLGGVKAYSVMEYCANAIPAYAPYPAYESLVTLLKALVNYGAASQVSLSHNVENPANSFLAEADQVLPELPDVSAYAAKVTGTAEGLTPYGASLLLKDTTTIRFYFKITGDITGLTFTVNGKEVTPVVTDSYCYVDMVGISARNLDVFYTASVGGITVEYCGLSYIVSSLKDPETADMNMLKALWAYSQAAEGYFK